MANQRVVLITGVSSGVGQSTARLLSQRALQGLWNKPQSSYRRNDPGGGDAAVGCARRRLGARVRRSRFLSWRPHSSAGEQRLVGKATRFNAPRGSPATRATPRQ